LLIAVLLIPAALGSSTTIFNDGDIGWHIATGQWILDHHAIPHVDPFSFTWVGKPWVPIEWLAEVFYGSAYRLAGYGGIAALVTAALMALHATIYFQARRFVRPWTALAALVGVDVVLIPMMLARPHVLAWPLIAIWTGLMLRARERDRAPPLAAALLMVVWTNLHGSFFIGLAIAGLFALEAMISSPDRRRAFRQWLLFGIACATAVLVNGNGLAGVLHPLQITSMATLSMIDEWKPSSPAITPYSFAVLALTIALIAWKRPRLHPVRWALLGLLVCAALLQVRHQAVLAIIGALLLPEGFAKGVEQQSAADQWLGVRVASAGALFLLVIRAVLPLSVPDNESNPRNLIASVPPQLRSQPVLNSYSFGGPLTLSGVRPFIDGRNDMYGDAMVLRFRRITAGDRVAFDQAVKQWNIRWAIVSNSSKPLIGLLDRSPGWRRIARDNVGVIYVRETPSA
jgi:hypothetical protein